MLVTQREGVGAVGERWVVLNDQRWLATGSLNAVSSVVGGQRLFSVLRKAEE